MVEYPDLSSLSNTSGISGLIAVPSASFPWFWTTILIGIFFIITWASYFNEKALKGRGNILSSMAISSLACIIGATLGSLVGMFTVQTLVPIVVFGVLIIGIWILSSNKN